MSRRPVRRVTTIPGARPPLARGLNAGRTRAYEVLTDTDVLVLIDAALALLADTGCAFEPGTEAIGLLRAAGADVTAEGIARLPPELVRGALATSARSVRLWDREGCTALELDCNHTWFLPGMTAIRISDRPSEPVRDSTRADLERIARVADALPNIDGVCLACKDVEHSDAAGEVGEFATLVRNTTKPLEYLCEFPESFETAIEIAAVVRGSAAALAEKPYFMQVVTPLPLAFFHTHSEQIVVGARRGIPVCVGTLPIGGASAPITLAGCLANSLATDFAAMVLGQLAAPGSFVVGCSDVRFMEPSTGGLGNLPQTWLADLAAHQVRRHLGLPSFTGVSGRAVAQRFDEDAVWEITGSLTHAFFGRPATLDYLGLIDNGMTYSLHALCLCDEMAGLLRTMWQGIEVSKETLALDLAHEVGPRGNYLARPHTARHCRDQLWPARYLGPHLPLSTDAERGGSLFERIDADLRRILDTHVPAPLPQAVEATLERIAAPRAVQDPMPA